jgi:OHCU decarboxylase
VASANAGVLDQFAQANQAYLDRFGFIFIVSATGKSAEEMLQLLRDRLGNDRATELRIAAEEQAKITALRLSY